MKKRLPFTLVILNLILGIILIFPPNLYPFRIIQSFAIQIITIIFFSSLLLIFLKKFWGFVSGLLLSLSLAFYIFFITVQPFQKPSLKSDGIHQGDEQSFIVKVMHFNVSMTNRDYASTLKEIEKYEPHLLSLQEVGNEWGLFMKRNLSDAYPYSISHLEVKDPKFGTAIYSKYELKKVSIQYFHGVPYITGEIKTPHGTIIFLAVHLSAPSRPGAMAVRNDHLVEIAREITRFRGHMMVIGDLNIVPWAPEMVSFKKTTDLLDSRTSISPTYPSNCFLFQVPIDYILYSRFFQCVYFTTIKETSSDHYGIYGEYVFLE